MGTVTLHRCMFCCQNREQIILKLQINHHQEVLERVSPPSWCAQSTCLDHSWCKKAWINSTWHAAMSSKPIAQENTVGCVTSTLTWELWTKINHNVHPTCCLYIMVITKYCYWRGSTLIHAEFSLIHLIVCILHGFSSPMVCDCDVKCHLTQR